MKEALAVGHARLTEVEVAELRAEMQADIQPELERIRAEQRHAFSLSRSLVLRTAAK